MRSRPLKAAGHFVAFRNLLLDRKVQIRERSSHAAKNVLQTLQPRTLTGKWNLLDYVLPHKPRSRVYIALRDHFFREAPNYRSIFQCAQSACLQDIAILSAKLERRAPETFAIEEYKADRISKV